MVTSDIQFRGAEVDLVIFVAKQWSGLLSNLRNPVTRAVAGLLMITSDYGIDVQALKEHWDVQIVEEGVKENQNLGTKTDIIPELWKKTEN